MNSRIYKLEGPRQLRLIEESLDPAAVGPKQIQARTLYSVISPGTELAAWNGLPPLRPGNVYPRLMGYCNLAEVSHVGREGAAVRVGELILTHQSHRSHFQCTEDEVLLVVAPDTPDDLLKKLTSTYLYHLGYNALLVGKYFPGHDVGIVGMGSLGMATASLVVAFGGRPRVFTNQPQLRELLKARNSVDVFDKSTGPQSDLTVNTSNAWGDHELALKTTRFGGTVVCLGFPGRGEGTYTANPLDSKYFYDNQLTLKHCGKTNADGLEMSKTRFNVKANIRYLASLIQSRKIDPTELLSRSYRADSLSEAYSDLSSKNANVFTSILDWR